jgi:hypothetical protein
MSARGIVAAMIVCLVAAAGCSDKGHVPAGILPIDKMEQVMWDMAQADQYASLYLAKDSARIDRKSETMRLYEEVFRLHEVSRDQFRTSYRYYLDHPTLNQVLFDSIMARGVRARTEMYDRPSTFRPPGLPGRPGISPGVTNPAGARPSPIPGRPGVTIPGRPGTMIPGRPGTLTSGTTIEPAGDALRRAQERLARRQDSIRRATQGRRDTTRGRP